MKKILLIAVLSLVLGACSSVPKEPPLGFERVTFNQGSQPISGYLIRALGTNRPVVIVSSGSNGIWNMRDRSNFTPLMSSWATMLNNRDWNVLIVDSLGSRNIYYDKPIASDKVTDIFYAVDWVKAQPDLKRSKTALLGFSDGATAVLGFLNAAKAQKTTGVIGAVAHYPTAGPFIGEDARKGGWFAPAMTDYDIVCPLMLTVGEEDRVVSVQAIKTLAENLNAKSAPVNLITYPACGHGYLRGCKDAEASEKTRSDTLGFLFDLLEK